VLFVAGAFILNNRRLCRARRGAGNGMRIREVMDYTHEITGNLGKSMHAPIRKAWKPGRIIYDLLACGASHRRHFYTRNFLDGSAHMVGAFDRNVCFQTAGSRCHDLKRQQLHPLKPSAGESSCLSHEAFCGDVFLAV
jgi:hypothetical protein